MPQGGHPPHHSITSSARASSVGGTVEAERLGGLEVDDQLELGGLLDRQVGGLLALENSAGVDAGLTVRVGDAAAVAHQAAGRDKLATLIDRGHRVAERQCGELFAAASEECIGADHERAGSQLEPRLRRPHRSRVRCWHRRTWSCSPRCGPPPAGLST